GLPGNGKSALAIEYANAFAHEYGGGRWQVNCERFNDLRAVFAELAPFLRLDLSDPAKANLNVAFGRVIAELHHLADRGAPRRCLILLDDVREPELLAESATERLPGGGLAACSVLHYAGALRPAGR